MIETPNTKKYTKFEILLYFNTELYSSFLINMIQSDLRRCNGRRDTYSLKTKSYLNYIERSIPYRAVNTLRLGYKNQSVNAVRGNNRCLFSDPHKTHLNALCGQNVELLNVKLAVPLGFKWLMDTKALCLSLSNTNFLKYVLRQE